MSPKSQVTNVNVAEVVQLLYCMGHSGMGALRPPWEHELDLEAFHHKILADSATGPDHRQPNTRGYQQLRINAAAREIVRAKGERHLLRSYRLVTGYVCSARLMSPPYVHRNLHLV